MGVPMAMTRHGNHVVAPCTEPVGQRLPQAATAARDNNGFVCHCFCFLLIKSSHHPMKAIKQPSSDAWTL
jgi:hypothetical protein